MFMNQLRPIIFHHSDAEVDHFRSIADDCNDYFVGVHTTMDSKIIVPYKSNCLWPIHNPSFQISIFINHMKLAKVIIFKT